MAYRVNDGGFFSPDDILEKVVSLNGLFRKIFGDLHDDIVYDKEAEFCRRMLREVYLFKDSDEIFPKILAERRFNRTLDTVFRFFKQPDNGNAGQK
jgi:hypothetical protein